MEGREDLVLAPREKDLRVAGMVGWLEGRGVVW